MAGFSSGTYSRSYDWTDDAAADVKIRADRMDEEMDAIATALSLCLLKDGTQTVTANIPMNSNKITGLGAPTASTDAATKGYVDDNITTFVNQTVRVATTANITIATALNDADTLDGITLADNDLVLVKDQTDASQNGIYVVSSSPARSTSYDTWTEVINLIVDVEEGTSNANTSWRSTVNAGGTIDSTDLTFASFGTNLTTPVSVANGGTAASTASAARTNLGIDTTFLALAGGTMTGETIFADQLVTRPFFKDVAETINALGSIGGGAQDIDLTLGNVVSGTVDTSTTTFTFSNPPATGRCGAFTLILTNGGSQTVNWPASVDWASGTAPTLTTAGVDILTFFTLDGGTIYYGFVAGLDMQ